MPEGYDTLIGERGAKLSGGQRQRIAIARIILKDPAILILDEATSALDSETGSQIRREINALVKGRTCIMISHDTASLVNADKIIVLSDGKIARVGNHQELVETCEEYKLGGRNRA